MMATDVTVVRIYCSEQDGRYRELLARLHEQEKVAGVTVFRAISGFGSSGRIHSAELLDMSLDLPLVVEFFDSPERVQAVIGRLREFIKPGHIVSWPAQVHD